jgi:2,3-bisphosphoglycerate-independent phosphoglycerate mutase
MNKSNSYDIRWLGKSPDPKVSAIDNANIPFIKVFIKLPKCPTSHGRPKCGFTGGTNGNSEVGHMNLGAGRIVYQDLAKINLAVANKTLAEEQVLKDAFQYAMDNNKSTFFRLVSDGGVHSILRIYEL